MKKFNFNLLLLSLVMMAVSCSEKEAIVVDELVPQVKQLEILDQSGENSLTIQVETTNQAIFESLSQTSFELLVGDASAVSANTEQSDFGAEELNLSNLAEVHVTMIQEDFIKGKSRYSLTVKQVSSGSSDLKNPNCPDPSVVFYYITQNDCIRVNNVSVCPIDVKIQGRLASPWTTLTVPQWVHVPPTGHVARCWPMSNVMRARIIASAATDFTVVSWN